MACDYKDIKRLSKQAQAGQGVEETNRQTLEHRAHVQASLGRIARELEARGAVHDQSKMESPEVELFSSAIPKLKGLAYGSEEYRAVLREIKPATEHHNSVNRHHPEFHGGVDKMNLVDLCEMVADWKAAAKRSGGNVLDSMDYNAKRHSLSPQLAQIIKNTLELLGGE